jgi:hypothetical protein
MYQLPEHQERYPTSAGREALASRLGLTINPFSQDWEWEVADPAHFEDWLALYHQSALSDDERFSLMEMLIQCVDDMGSEVDTPEEVEKLPQWQAVATLLRSNPQLHASSIVYWSVFGQDDADELFRVSLPMRKLWAAVQGSLV